MNKIKKAKFAEECTRCGECCRLQLCHVAEVLFQNDCPPCPALGYNDDRTTYCKVVELEKALDVENVAAMSLGIGCGCSMPDDDTTEEEIELFDDASRKMMFGEASEL